MYKNAKFIIHYQIGFIIANNPNDTNFTILVLFSFYCIQTDEN